MDGEMQAKAEDPGGGQNPEVGMLRRGFLIRISSKAIVALAAGAFSFMAAPLAAALQTATGPYDSTETDKPVSADLTGLASTERVATASTNGALNTAVTGTSIAPLGIAASGRNIGIAKGGATAAVVHKFVVTGTASLTIDVEFSSVSARASSSRGTPCNTTSSPPPNCEYLAGSEDLAEAFVSVAFFRCNPYQVECAPGAANQQVIRLASAYDDLTQTYSVNLLTVTVPLNVPQAETGTLVVKAGLRSEVTLRGMCNASASASGTVSSITVNP